MDRRFCREPMRSLRAFRLAASRFALADNVSLKVLSPVTSWAARPVYNSSFCSSTQWATALGSIHAAPVPLSTAVLPHGECLTQTWPVEITPPDRHRGRFPHRPQYECVDRFREETPAWWLDGAP